MKYIILDQSNSNYYLKIDEITDEYTEYYDNLDVYDTFEEAKNEALQRAKLAIESFTKIIEHLKNYVKGST